MEKTFFHIDVNSAFLSWSSLKRLHEGCDLDLRNIPSVIGGDMDKRHGVVLAKSVPAKAFHIVTGEPIVHALRKCPHLTIEPPSHTYYEMCSKNLLSFLSEVCPDIEKLSIDECFMDFTPIAARYNNTLEAAKQIKNAVYEKFGFTVNIGISNKKVLAKMASDFKKPNLVHTLYTDEIAGKLWPLPVSVLYMCGKSSAETLRKLGILTIGDLANADISVLTSHLKSHGQLLWEYANGIDNSIVESEPYKLKGIGNSITLSEDAYTKEAAKRALLSLADSVSDRLRASHQLAGMVSTEIKFHTFQAISHQMTLQTPTNINDVIYNIACRLFDEMWDGTPIRLLGIRTSQLIMETEPMQLDLFDISTDIQSSNCSGYPKTENKQMKKSMEELKNLDAAVDKIRNKYGKDAIVRGSFLKNRDEFKKH